MNPLIVLTIFFMALPFAAFPQMASFDCKGAETLISVLSEGPDGAADYISNAGVSFIYGTIGGWRCLPMPLDMENEGRTYIESIDCFYSVEQSPDNEEIFYESGQIFQKSIGDVVQCFSGSIINSFTRAYSPPARGESFFVLLDTEVKSGYSFQGKALTEPLVLLEYGYSQNNGSDLYWSVVVRPAISDADIPN